ncbi:hypothetical protein BCR35DRAFT_247007, partial [Leucosporidium creatinivorum]
FAEAITEMNINPDLSPEQDREIRELISRFPMVFAHGSNQIGHVDTHVCDLKFNTTELPPRVRQSAYPVSAKTSSVMRDLVEDLQRKGVVRPSKSRFAAPALVVKSAGKHRLAVNYKVLNSITENDSYPMPRVTSAIHSLSGSKYLT